MEIQFTKMEGLGNDFILVDNRDTLFAPDYDFSEFSTSLIRPAKLLPSIPFSFS